jgi:hypothetical protein
MIAREPALPHLSLPCITHDSVTSMVRRDKKRKSNRAAPPAQFTRVRVSGRHGKIQMSREQYRDARKDRGHKRRLVDVEFEDGTSVTSDLTQISEDNSSARERARRFSRRETTQGRQGLADHPKMILNASDAISLPACPGEPDPGVVDVEEINARQAPIQLLTSMGSSMREDLPDKNS